MKSLDRFLQSWRMGKAAKWTRPGDRVLDVGCHQGEFFRKYGREIGISVGIDPLAVPRADGKFRLINGHFPDGNVFPRESFDTLIMLAVIEHVEDRASIFREAAHVLSKAGRVIVTVPSPRVDAILEILVRLKIADGMSLEEHGGFDPESLPETAGECGFRVLHRESFQFGLNNLMVFEKTS